MNLIAKKAGIRLVQKRKDASQVEPHVKVGISHLTLPPDKIIISNFGYKKICLIHSVCNWKPFRVNGQSKTIDESIDSFTKKQKLISIVLLHHWLYCFYDRNRIMVIITKKGKIKSVCGWSCLTHLTSWGAKVRNPVMQGSKRDRHPWWTFSTHEYVNYCGQLIAHCVTTQGIWGSWSLKVKISVKQI